MSHSPPKNFWPPKPRLSSTGITGAINPLYISGNSVGIIPATATGPGSVTEVAQVFGGVKTFSNGLALAAGPTVTAVTDDGNLTGAATWQLATARATKEYIDSHEGAISAAVPIYLDLGTLYLRNTLGANLTGFSPSTSLSPGDDTTIPTQGAVGSYISSYVSSTAVTNVSSPLVWTPPGPLQIRNNVSGVISTVSTDGTLSANSDLIIPTQKAVRTYVGLLPAPYITSVSAPLSVSSGNLTIANASVTSSGVVTTGVQVMAGAKTFTGILSASSGVVGSNSGNGSLVVTGTVGTSAGAWLGGNLTFDGIPSASPPTIKTSVDGNHLHLTADVGGAAVDIQSGSYGGNLVLSSGTPTGAETQIYDGGTGGLLFSTTADELRGYRPLLITVGTPGPVPSGDPKKSGRRPASFPSKPRRVVPDFRLGAALPMLTLIGDTGSAAFALDTIGGGLSIATGGAGLTTSIDTVVTVANTTESSGPGVGALKVAGGVAVAKALRVAGATYSAGVTSTTPNGTSNLSLASGTTTASFSMPVGTSTVLSTSGPLSLTTNSNSVVVASDSTLAALNTTEATAVVGAIRTSGGVSAAKSVVAGGAVRSAGVYSTLAAAGTPLSIKAGTAQCDFDISVGGTTAVFATGDFTIGSGGGHVNISYPAELRALGSTDSTSSITGAFTVTGGAGVGKNLYVGQKVYSAGFVGTAAVDTAQVDMSSGAITASLVLTSGGALNIVTSGPLLWNGFPISPVYETTTLNFTTVGAIAGMTAQISFHRVGLMVTARVTELLGSPTSTDNIRISGIPALYRSWAPTWGPTIVAAGLPGPNLYKNGSWCSLRSGEMYWYNGVNNDNFANTLNTAGWQAHTASWITWV